MQGGGGRQSLALHSSLSHTHNTLLPDPPPLFLLLPLLPPLSLLPLSAAAALRGDRERLEAPHGQSSTPATAMLPHVMYPPLSRLTVNVVTFPPLITKRVTSPALSSAALLLASSRSPVPAPDTNSQQPHR
eukprot:2048959-Rhodomonas_salina.2